MTSNELLAHEIPCKAKSRVRTCPWEGNLPFAAEASLSTKNTGACDGHHFPHP
jgi:hypothetical protein